MRKIIDGRVYDTSTATHVAGYEENLRQSSYIAEDLYRKRTGEYFLHGKGGAMSAYQTRVDSTTWTGGEAIIPISIDRARAWMEQHATDTEYETEFGEVVEDASTVVQAVSLRADLLERAKRHAAEKGESLSGLIARLLENEIR